MKITLTTSQIANHLRQDDNAAWSYNGARALAEYLEEMEQCNGEEMELDVVAIRCDYSEYESLSKWAIDYFGGINPAMAHFDCTEQELIDGDIDDKVRDFINDNGQLIEFAGGIIVSSF